MVNLAINGIGRIGKLVLRLLISKNYNVKYLNELNGNTSSLIHSIEFDSIHGKWQTNLEEGKNIIKINDKSIKTTFFENINDLSLDDIDIMIDCTGAHKSSSKLQKYFDKGVKKVIVSAPCKNADKTIVYGVNENTLKKNDKIISAASCTTNCLAPVAYVLNNNYQIEKGFMTTIHAFTTDQRILDNSHKDPRRARSASQSIVPTSTGASKAIGDIIPSLKGKLEGVAMRVPTPNVSLIELVFCTKRDLSVEKINKSFLDESKKSLKGVLDITKEKLVSVDFNHNSLSAIIDASLTSVVGKNMGKISAWYDNEWGFSNRMCDIAETLHKIS